MKLNNVYYLYFYQNHYFGKSENLDTRLNHYLSKTTSACNWIIDHYEWGEDVSDYNTFLHTNGITANNDGSHVLQELIFEKESWPTKKALEKGICFRNVMSFKTNNREQNDTKKMRLPEISNVPYRKNWNLSKNWLSDIAKKNPNLIGGLFDMSYDTKKYNPEIGGIEHQNHVTSFSVCRDNPDKPTINICNTWGGTCSLGKTNPWGPQWDPKNIFLDELHLFQYFPPI